MSCEELRDSFELYALGLLDGEEKSEMDSHLSRGCEHCRRALNDALAINTLILTLPAEAVPPHESGRSAGFGKLSNGHVREDLVAHESLGKEKGPRSLRTEGLAA